MRKALCLISLVLACFSAVAQLSKWEFGVLLGGSNYVGDINSSFNSNEKNAQWNQFESSFDFYNTNFLGGIFARYNINSRWTINAGLNFTRIEGEDAHFNNPRNLSFHSNLNELNIMCEFNFFSYQTGSRLHRITPYLFAGIAGFYFNPKAIVNNPITLEQEEVELRPLNTEGQGMEGYPKAYSRYGFAIPFGLGMKFSLGKYVCIGLQWGFRKTFTDYLDDISTKYVDHETLVNWGGELSAEAADRTHELSGMEGYYHPHNTARGNSNTKDWYNFFGITISTKLSLGSKKCL